MRAYVGTSGYSYAAWRGKFYPRALPAKQMLGYYAEQFGAVEINSTFYRLPAKETLNSWAEQVPRAFRFSLKVPGQVTHRKESAQAALALRRFLALSATLGRRAGPLLFQFPPYLKKDVARLSRLLDLLPQPRATAFEFRHASWFDDEVLSLLRRRRAALCLAEADGFETPRVATGTLGYLRLRKAHYTPAALKRWASFLADQSWSTAYVFFRHEDEAKGPGFARKLLQHLGRAP